MMKLYLINGILLLIGHTGLFAQAVPEIATDRPDQTETPHTVPVNHLQMETGVSMEQTDDHTKAWSSPNILFKFGVTNDFELGLIAEYATVKYYNQTVSGLTPVGFRFKKNLFKEKGIIPLTSFIGYLTIPNFASKNFKATYLAPAFRFTMQNDLTDKMSVSYNLGAEWDGETAGATYLYTLSLGYSMGSKLGGFVELYGFAPHKSKPDHRFDCGLTYLLRKNIMIDASGGIGITKNAPKYFLSTGFSFRLPG